MQLRDKTALQKILEIIKESLEIFGDIPLEKFLSNKERQLAMAMSILAYTVFCKREMVIVAKQMKKILRYNRKR